MNAIRKPDLRNLTILVVDDSDFARKLVSQILLTFGVGRVVTAKSGKEGYTVAQESRPDIVISDWDMPDGSGEDLVKQLRNSEDSICKYAGFVMLTAYAERSRVLASRDFGISEFLTKPVSPANLYARLMTIIEHPRPFVTVEGDYFGPDRRRMISESYDGDERRAEMADSA